MEAVIVLVVLFLTLLIVKAIFVCIANAVKGIFGFIAKHFVAIVVVLAGGGLLWGWLASMTSPEGKLRRQWKAEEAQYQSKVQSLEARRAKLQQEIDELQKMEVGPQGNTRLHKVKPFQSWKEKCSQSRDSRVTEDKWRQMYLAYLYKQARSLLTGSKSWRGLEERIRKLQEDANASLADFEQSHSANQKAASSAEEVFR